MARARALRALPARSAYIADPRAFAPYKGRFARSPGFGGFGRLGATPVSAAGASAAGYGATAGASAIATYAGAGAVAGPIGAVVGAVVGLVVGSLLNKQYLNVAQANAGEDNAVAAFNQYRSIAGQVPGRQFGVDAMNVVWNGAVYSGLFPLNKGQACFHDGCLKYPGDPDWVWGTFHDGANNQFTFAYAYQQWSAARQQFAAAAGSTSAVPQIIRGTGFSRLAMAGFGMDLTAPLSSGVVDLASRFAGLGDTNAVVGQPPDAVVFIDQFFIPNAQRDSPAWAVPQSPLEHQILYDAADAWLATQPVVTVPYVGSQSAPAASPTLLPASSSTNLPAIVPTSGGSASFVSTGAPGNAAISAPINPVTASGQPVLNPFSTPLLPSAPLSTAAASTSAVAATAANLDAAMAAQGFTRVGTNSSGFPLYSQAGMVYAYQNGQLYPSGTVAQLAATGGAGTGISTPTTGIDPNTLAAIVGALQAGATASQASQAGANTLAAQGVPITPDVQAQLDQAAQQPAIAAGPSSNMILIGIAAVVGVILLTKH